MKWNSETTPRFTYEYNARGQAACLKSLALDREQHSEYDLADRPCRISETQAGSHLYTGEVRYDAVKGNLQSFTERVGTNYTKYQTTFAYDTENRPKTLSYGDTSNQTVLTYDLLGRITQRVVKVGGYSYSSTYSFIAGGHGDNSTTALVSKITQTGETLTYTYDNVGNIATVKRDAKNTKYTYDALGQLTRVDDQNDTTSGSTGTTWTYEYDRGGNILNKKRYAYTTGTLGSVLQTITYTYGDSNWKDKLTAYNGSAITYDVIGNPTNDGIWTYTWEKGRQLKQMSKSGTTATFLYNADGLRIRKTVGSMVTNYTLHGKNIVHLTQGSNTLHFFYDAQNRPAIVNYNGTKYAYQYSLQGDVIELIDSSGTQVVRYVYDAWGKVLSTTGSLASTLGTVQPFRYRGYVYDTETGFYYLRSRYYSPTRGRFFNADALVKGNVYCYCSDNPICKEDNNGHDFEWCGNSYEYGARKKRGNNSTRKPLSKFLDEIYQMIGVWKYPEDGKGCSYGYVDCTGLYEFPMYVYFDEESLERFHADGNNTDRIYESGLYNGDVRGCKGKGPITPETELVPGMALFIYGYDEKKKKYHLLHMAIYVGDYFEGYENAIIESIESGVVIRTLSDSERIHEAQYTYCGYFRGIDYDK